MHNVGFMWDSTIAFHPESAGAEEYFGIFLLYCPVMTLIILILTLARALVLPEAEII